MSLNSFVLFPSVSDPFGTGIMFANNSIFTISESSGSNWISNVTRSGSDTDQFMIDLNISQVATSSKPGKYIGLVNSSES